MRRFASLIALAALSFTPLFAQAPTKSSTQATTQQQTSHPKCVDNATYVNSKGQTVKRPENCSAAPQGLQLNAAMGATVSAGVAGEHAHIMEEWLNGFESDKEEQPETSRLCPLAIRFNVGLSPDKGINDFG